MGRCRNAVLSALVMLSLGAGATEASKLNSSQRVLAPLLTELGDFKFLKLQLEMLEQRIALPGSVRQALKSAVTKNDIEIHPFGLDFKKEYDFPVELGGLVIFPVERLRMLTPFDFILNLNELNIRKALDRVMEKYQHEWFKKDYTVFLPDEKIKGSKYNPLLVTIHELAHVDFHRRVSLLRKEAVLPLRRDLFTYVNERYAHEIEFLLLKAIQRNPDLFHRTPEKWLSRAHLDQGLLARRSIAKYVREVYGLRDLRLAQLDSVPVDDLMKLLKE